eukprot:TRINITY_DN655_c0_g1_i5.p1 TRINITY_DN655_c0_g1~~TRINITY_DN655_c0_g1_i5.p1  ORF type:complete len:248 (-),score=32.85 TRINITY_DN655_c0_g1_i5:111-854(-)
MLVMVLEHLEAVVSTQSTGALEGAEGRRKAAWLLSCSGACSADFLRGRWCSPEIQLSSAAFQVALAQRLGLRAPVKWGARAATRHATAAAVWKLFFQRCGFAVMGSGVRLETDRGTRFTDFTLWRRRGAARGASAPATGRSAPVSTLSSPPLWWRRRARGTSRPRACSTWRAGGVGGAGRLIGRPRCAPSRATGGRGSRWPSSRRTQTRLTIPHVLPHDSSQPLAIALKSSRLPHDFTTHLINTLSI